MIKKYLLSLAITLVAFVVGYFAIESLTQNPAEAKITLLVGLLLGHLIGFLFSSKRIQFGISADAESNDIQTLYVGNLPFKTTRYELRELFQPYGKIISARIMIDRATHKPKGFGFVEMDKQGASKAIASLNGAPFAGRNLKVSEANDRS